MENKPLEILLVEDDADLAGMMAQTLERATGAHLTHVTTATDALREELTTRHHLIIISFNLKDIDGLSLTRKIRVHNSAPIVLMADEISTEQCIEAMRLAVADILLRPFDLTRLIGLVRGLQQRQERLVKATYRRRKLRRLVSRMLRERREVQDRMDLLCRDFVQAYRRLAQKVEEACLTAPESDH